MRKAQILDLLINVLFPLSIGISIYFVSGKVGVNRFIRNEIPDGLWAYSLISVILIIWQRKIKAFWICATLLFFLLFELLQYFHVINGTGDWQDVVIYFCFSYIALASNNFFRLLFKS
jgi:hypothetical protein